MGPTFSRLTTFFFMSIGHPISEVVFVPASEMGAVRKLWLRFSWRRPVTWSLRHSVAGTQRRKQTTLKHENLLDQKNAAWDQLASLLTVNYSSIFIFENAWEGHWFSEWLDWRPFTSEAKIEVIDGRMWCSAQVRLRKDIRGDSISLCEISPGIGWRADYMHPLLRRS